jgi:hypothetical protein
MRTFCALWDQVKSSGLAAVPIGPPSASAVALLAELQAQRVLVIPCGELEGFDRTVLVAKTLWVNEMLEKNRHKTNVQARELVKKIG